MSLRAFYLFIELLVARKMSCMCYLTPFNALKGSKYMVVAQILNNHLSFFLNNLAMNNT